MKVLLDTCCIIWAISNPDSLSEEAIKLLQHEGVEIFISPISAAEIACASERGRIVLDRPWNEWFRHYVALNGWNIEVLDLDVIETAYSLPGEFHADPADRFITATAMVKDFILLTADRKILNYPHVNAVW